MATFGGGLSSLWDFSLPAAVPEISDDQFLSLLNSQFAAQKDPLGAPPLPLNGLPHNPTANPAALTHYPPQQLNLSPLQSEESESPSPPGAVAADLPGIRSRKQSQTTRASARNARSTASDDLKRKASDDQDEDDDDEDGHRDKTFHADDDGPSRKSGARRKSGSGGQKSEDRVMKRKEQNRAAQRAFRERKEKHVRDLEEKVAMLEAKSDLQQAENENLRDLLSRLQNENTSLKRSQFTFSVSSNADSSTVASNTTSKSPSSASTQATSPSMSLLGPTGDGYDHSMAYFSPSFFGNSPLPSTANGGNSVGSQPQADLSQYGIGAPYSLPAQSPYTTIAANPLYMSFQDPSPHFSAYLSPSAGSSSTPSSSPSNGLSSNMTTDPMGAALSPRTMNEIFGGQLDGLMSFNGGSAYGDMLASGSLSPPAASTSAMQTDDDHQNCPKSAEDVAEAIASNVPGTFGPPIASAMDVEQPQNAISATFMTPGEEEEMMATMSDETVNPKPCHLFPAVRENSKNVSLPDAWERVSKHPQFNECDMDELCALLTAQAKCDGSKPVLEPSSVSGVMEKIPQLARK